MKLIMFWAIFSIAFGWKVKRIDRWTVLAVVGFCAANVAYAYLTFDPVPGGH